MIDSGFPFGRVPRGIEAIAFDAFGTLIDYVVRLYPYRRLLVRRAGDVGADVAAQRHRFLTSSDSLERWGDILGLQDRLPVIQQELGQELAALRLYPDVVDVVRTLRAAGYRVGVCSNLAQAYGEAVRSLLAEHVDALVLSFEVGFAKPDPAIFADLCRRLAVAPSSTLFIGDSVESDVYGARRAGMSALRIRRDMGQGLQDLLGGSGARLFAQKAP